MCPRHSHVRLDYGCCPGMAFRKTEEVTIGSSAQSDERIDRLGDRRILGLSRCGGILQRLAGMGSQTLGITISTVIFLFANAVLVPPRCCSPEWDGDGLHSASSFRPRRWLTRFSFTYSPRSYRDACREASALLRCSSYPFRRAAMAACIQRCRITAGLSGCCFAGANWGPRRS